MTADGVEDQLKPRERQLAELKRFEELFGGRVLAWVGGLATLLGLVFLVGIALERGWIDESMRIVLGFLGSTLSLLVGFWLYERKGHTEAALAAVGSGLAGLYATLLVGTQVYDLIPSSLGLACAALVGVVGVAIAVRWKSAIVAAIGILGGLSAPALVGTGTSELSVAFMAIALATAVGELALAWGLPDLGAAASDLDRRKPRRAPAGHAGCAGRFLGALPRRRDRL
jgi:uncharacterized membrane protein